MPKRNSVTGTDADPLVEYVPLTIGGKTYQLAFTFLALARAEQVVNRFRAPGEDKCNLLHGLAMIVFTGLDVRELLGLLYGALLPTNPKISLDDTSRLINAANMSDIHEALLYAYRASLKIEKTTPDPPEGAAVAPATN